MPKPIKTTIKRKKFFEVKIPLLKTKIELTGKTIENLKDRVIRLDLTRQLRGKSVEANFKVKIEDNQAIAQPKKITLMPYFIKRMIRKRISYVEDSFTAKTQESLVKIKPFLITRNKVSKVVRKTLRNLTKNWIEDYLAEKKDDEIFEDILANRLQKPLSIKLKKTYPLSLCEIRILEILYPLKPEEIPKIKLKKQKEIKEIINQSAEIEQEKIKKAEKEIKKTQEKAEEITKKPKLPAKKKAEKIKEKPKKKTKTTTTKKK